MKDIRIEYHADDYGMFPEQSKRMIDCIKNGSLNGVSVMPNNAHLKKCMEMLSPYRDRVRVTIHLNIAEGRSLVSHEKLPLITKEDGTFNCSYGRLLLISFVPFLRGRYRSQLRREFRAQIKRLLPHLDPADIRIDSHVHFHMIPVVFDALMDAIKDLGIRPSYLRIPMGCPGIYKGLENRPDAPSLLNLIKAIVLYSLSLFAKARYKDLPCKGYYFPGTLYAGRMNKRNTRAVLEGVRRHLPGGSDAVLLFHPGGVYEEADIACLTYPGDINFLTDRAQREAEAAALKDSSCASSSTVL